MRGGEIAGADGLRLIGVHVRVRTDEPCVLARTGNPLTIWAIPDEVVNGVLV